MPKNVNRSAAIHLGAQLAFLLTLAVAVPVYASQFGRDGFSGNPDTNAGAVCSVCHAAGNAEAPFVIINGPAQVDAGTTESYTVTLVRGPAVSGGVNVSVQEGVGALASADARLQLVEGELAHTEPQPFGSSGLLTFRFLWTAPNYDADVVFYAAGNSTNGNLDLIGDGVGTATFDVSVVNGFEEPPPPPPPTAPSAISLEAFASGLFLPVALTNAGDARLFAVEQEGRVRVISPGGQVLAQPFLDIADRVKLGGSEEGMLGLAFHPDYATNGYFYVNYIFDPDAGNNRTRISRFQVSGDPDVADAESELVLLEFEQPYSNHNGGDLHFGPDGYLYIASGDGGSGGDPQNSAQNPQRLLGKILRLDVDTTPGPDNGPDCAFNAGANYAIPPRNAFVDGPGGVGCDEIFALGLRNPWRISFDRLTGHLWVADVGQNSIEEVDLIPAGSGGGLNLGWRCYEGTEPYDLRNCNRTYLSPVYQYPHTDGNCSVTGGFVYRGQDHPSLHGRYFFSDFCNPAIRTLSGPPSALVEAEVLPAGDVLFSTFGEDARGELYGADFLSGIVYRIVATRLDGDIDDDGDVDRADLLLVWRALGMPADGPNDPRDLDGDGSITRRDLVLVFRNCTRAYCAAG